LGNAITKKKRDYTCMPIPVKTVCYYPGMKVGQAFQPDASAKSGWKA
jgi:hypothetical protein